MSVHIRPIAAEELQAFHRAMSVPFLFDPTPERLERFRITAEVDRLRVAVDGDQIVGTLGALSLKMAVPGNVLPTAGTSVITVLPTYRRGGILRKMMTEHLAEVHQNGEPLAALWASESSIYGRFGYGPATERVSMKLEKPYARLRESPDIQGMMRLVDREEAEQLFPRICDEVVPKRSGMLLRSASWWKNRSLGDPEERRFGATAHRRVVCVRDGRPVGYAIYRTRNDPYSKTTEVRIPELIGLDPQAEKALWKYLFGIDLTTSIEYWNLPVDDPLWWWLEESRRMERKIEDGLWVRPVDVAAALEGRRYSCRGSVTIRIHDRICPWNDGVFRLEAGDDGIASCRQKAVSAEIEMTPYALATVYLGAQRFLALARSGLVTGQPAALQMADKMFGWDRLPWCQEVF